MLTILESLPEALLRTPAAALHEVLPGPTLIHLPGRREPPVFVSVLLHGNETTGLTAVQALLRHYAKRPLPRALSIFIGNVQAARHGLRRLDGQPDYNRIWRGGPSPEHAMARQVLDIMRARGAFASLDIHNNTGCNPHYACVNRLDHHFFHLASLFSRTVVYFIRPNTVQSLAFAEFCPAVTVECGQPGAPHGAEHALAFLDAALNLAELPDHPIAPREIDLFHTVATVTIPEGVSFGFCGTDLDLRLVEDLDQLNFREIPAGTLLGWFGAEGHGRLEAWDEQGRDVSRRYFRVVDGELRTAISFMPSMFTLDRRVIRQDCLGYIMERYTVPGITNRNSSRFPVND